MTLQIPLRRILLVLTACILFLIILDAVPVIFRRVVGQELLPPLKENEAGRRTDHPGLVLNASPFCRLGHFLLNIPARTGARRTPAFRADLLARHCSGVCLPVVDEAAGPARDPGRDGDEMVNWYAPFAGSFFLVCLYYFVWVRKDDRLLRTWVIGGLVVYALGGLGAEFFQDVTRLTSEMMRIEQTIERVWR